MKAGDKIIYDKSYPNTFKNGKWEHKLVRFIARIMALAEGYAMLRRPRCAPYVESVKDLEKWRIK